MSIGPVSFKIFEYILFTNISYQVNQTISTVKSVLYTHSTDFSKAWDKTP